jgi:signal transduction histidine kinase
MMRAPRAVPNLSGMAALPLAGTPRLPRWSDLLVAAGAVFAGQLVVWLEWGGEPFYGSRPYNAVLSLLMLGVLAWWRQAPVAAVVWYVALFCGVQAVIPHDLPSWTGYFPLVVLVAAAGRTARGWPAVAALVVALVGFALLGVLEPTLRRADTFAFDALVLALPWCAGRLLAVRSARADALEADLTSLVAAQEEHEREVVAHERARLAQELHDVVAHSVSLMVVQVGAARMALGDDVEPTYDTVRGQLLGAEQTGRSALDELRRLLGVLRDPEPPALWGSDGPAAGAPTEPLPGLGEVSRLVEDFRARGVDVHLSVDAALDDADRGLGLTVYRVVQEGLTNALKHAPGAEVNVRVTSDAHRVGIEITDRGGRSRTGPGTGFGLVGTRERVALYGGHLEAGPTDTGWRLAVELPRADSTRTAGAPRASSGAIRPEGVGR